jgi:hypothetical protein
VAGSFVGPARVDRPLSGQRFIEALRFGDKEPRILGFEREVINVTPLRLETGTRLTLQ